ncbi:MAG: RES family NAD+ phosphorylase [Trueperaceae bacterium]|nr:RES family NAD+ phosphorylase [Trueperaceae bacterium]
MTDEPQQAWRLVRPAYGTTGAAFSGEGARRYGGRWNSAGRPLVYASEHLSLAALETLAHAERSRFQREYVAFAVEIPAELVLMLRRDDLPSDWRVRPNSPGARAIGDAWLEQAASVALLVPSVLVPQEHNLLLNPVHPDFEEVVIGAGAPFWFDERL